jgi:hypothetical protein
MIVVPSVRGLSTRSPITEEAVMVTTKSSGTFYLQVAASGTSSPFSSYRITVLWWDGTKTTQSYDAGQILDVSSNSGIYYTFSKSVSSPYNNSNPKTVRVFTSTTSGRALGYHRNFYIDTINASDFNFFSDNGLTSIDVTGLGRLSNLTTSLNSGLTSLGRLPKTLTTIYADNCSLSSINVTGLSVLSVLSVYSNSISTITGLSTCSNLNSLSCQNNQLTSLNLNGLSNLGLVYCQNNSNLSSITAVGVGGNMGSFYSYSTYSNIYTGINLSGCNMSGTALNSLYTDLDSPGSGYGQAWLLVGGQSNGGEANDTPSIATNKGYTVLGT